jgi:hypothetical protein
MIHPQSNFEEYQKTYVSRQWDNWCYYYSWFHAFNNVLLYT